MTFKSITDTPRRGRGEVKFISFNAQSGTIRISSEMREMSDKWEIEFNADTLQVRLKPSEGGFRFRINCMGSHKAFVDSLGLDKRKTNIRFELTINDDGWYYS